MLMKKILALLGLTSLLLSQSVFAYAASPKTGSVCTKIGEIKSSGGLKFTCVKSGKKIVWSKGVKENFATPSPSAAATTIKNPATDTGPAPGRICIEEGSHSSFGSETLVCSNRLWRLELESNSSNSNYSTYVPKNAKVSEKDLETLVLANWADWKKNKLNKPQDMQIILQSGYSKEWETITRETINQTGNILDGNGLKLVQTPLWVFGDTEAYRHDKFNDFAKTASCKPPYIAEGEEAIYCATADIGSGGIRINKPGEPMANNYKLNETDKKLLTYFVAHDMGIFYEVQAEYGDVAYTGLMYQIPSWIREGTAQLIGTLVTNDLRNAAGSYIKLRADGRMGGIKPATICAKDLQDAEGKDKWWPDNCSYSMNFYAVQLLVAKYGGLDALFKFPKLYGQNTDWVSDFKEAFGISREDFYREWWAYLGIPQSKWPQIRVATAPERY